jgi:hypothetical protein
MDERSEGCAMVDKTALVLPGKKLSVPRVIKRTLQISAAIGLTAAVALVVVTVSSLLLARGSVAQGLNIWLAFIKRSDILATMILTAVVTVAFVYWQRNHERR